jgi:DNA-binding XRE family transcriptional regulator
MEKAPRKFIDWFEGNRKKENLGIRQMAVKIGVSHPTITAISTYGEMPSFETCKKIAKYFNYPPVGLLEMAGLLPENHRVEGIEELIHLSSQLPQSERDELVKIARLKLEKQ